MKQLITRFLHLVISITLLIGLSACGSIEGPELLFIHTNDTHSQIDGIYLDERPVGGVEERASFLEMMRQRDPELLYLDAGDMVQGSPYFNIWGGMVEMKAMNLQWLLCSTFGNHEFDNGIEGLAKMLNFACFPIINCNYDVKGTALEPYTRPWLVTERKGIRIGITGVTCDPRNLIFNRNWEGIRYIDPSEAANKTAAILREQGCDLVILLSHVGYFTSDSLGDRRIAMQSKDIDIIIGGHTHTNIENGEVVLNAEGRPVVITQTGAKTSPIGMVKIKMKSNGKHSDGRTAYAVEKISCSKLHPSMYDLRPYGRTMTDFITPYRDSLEQKMSDVLGVAAHDLPRFRPESPLGNFASDVLREVIFLLAFTGDIVRAFVIFVADKMLTHNHVVEVQGSDEFDQLVKGLGVIFRFKSEEDADVGGVAGGGGVGQGDRLCRGPGTGSGGQLRHCQRGHRPRRHGDL